MNMVSKTAYNEYRTIQLVADAPKITMQFGLNRWSDKCSTAFRAKYDMYIILYERLSHVFCVAPRRAGYVFNFLAKVVGQSQNLRVIKIIVADWKIENSAR